MDRGGHMLKSEPSISRFIRNIAFIIIICLLLAGCGSCHKLGGERKRGMGMESAGVLDPYVVEFLKQVSKNLPLSKVPLDLLRTQLPDIFKSPTIPVKKVLNIKIPGGGGEIPVRVYIPVKETNVPVVIFYHGGGWATGSVEFYDNVTRALANKSGFIVVSVDYRLAPENPFPAAIDDAYAALEWVAKNAKEIGGDPRRIAVAGDSAGGNLAAVIALKARDENGPPISFQVLIYPVLNVLSLHTKSYDAFAKGYYLLKDDMEYFRSLYLPHKKDWTNPYASPLLAKDVSKLPPALIITDEFDILRDEGEAYANRLKETGVPVRLSRYPGMIHGFINVPMIKTSEVALDEIAADLKEAFGN